MATWAGVELRHLVALEAIHEERSFRGAADRLGYVQSAVSQQIAHLERLVGARLVDRSRGQSVPVALTEAGLLVLDHSRRILGQLRAAQADLRALNEGGRQRLRVGVFPSVSARLLPPLLRTLAQTDELLAVAIDETDSDRDQSARVRGGELDAAFSELPLADGPFEAIEVLEDPCVLLMPANDPMSCRISAPTLEQIARRPLIAVEGWGMMDLIEAQLRRVREPEFVLRVNTSSSAQALVGAGLGSAVLPRLAVDETDSQTTFVDLSPLFPPRRVGLYWLEGRHDKGALRALASAASSAADELRATFNESPLTPAEIAEPALAA